MYVYLYTWWRQGILTNFIMGMNVRNNIKKKKITHVVYMYWHKPLYNPATSCHISMIQQDARTVNNSVFISRRCNIASCRFWDSQEVCENVKFLCHPNLSVRPDIISVIDRVIDLRLRGSEFDSQVPSLSTFLPFKALWMMTLPEFRCNIRCEETTGRMV